MVRISTCRSARSRKTSQQLVHLLAHADDDAGLGHLGAPASAAICFARRRNSQRALVPSAGLGDGIEARHGLDVVVQYLRLRGDDHAQRLLDCPGSPA
jgi:hypothetical protein